MADAKDPRETHDDEPVDTGLHDEDGAIPFDAANEDDAPLAEEDPASETDQQIAELKDQLVRTIAELDNTRKRTEREKEQIRKFGIANFAKDLLTAADNLRRAIESVPEGFGDGDPAMKNLLIGIEMTEKDFLSAFEKHGVRKIEPMGEKFDYNFHQAIFEVENSGQAPGTVVQVMQPGYAIGDRILRAAMVGVAKGAPPSDAAPVDTTA